MMPKNQGILKFQRYFVLKILIQFIFNVSETIGMKNILYEKNSNFDPFGIKSFHQSWNVSYTQGLD